MNLTPQQTQRLAAAPVGHLSTASRAGAPHVIPVCFALDPDTASPALYIVLDRKPKRAALTRLRRVRNLLDNPQVALLIDHYDQDWTQLWYILLTGTAQLLDAPAHPESVEGLNPQGSAHPELVEGPNPVDSAHPEPNSKDPQPSGLPAHPEPVEGRSRNQRTFPRHPPPPPQVPPISGDGHRQQPGHQDNPPTGHILVLRPRYQIPSPSTGEG